MFAAAAHGQKYAWAREHNDADTCAAELPIICSLAKTAIELGNDTIQWLQELATSSGDDDDLVQVSNDSKELRVLLSLPDPDEALGFLAQAGVYEVVKSSGLLADDDAPRRSLLLYMTSTQHTWLVSTQRKLLCVLDDEKQRRKGKLIMWSMTYDEARTNIVARPKKKTVGLVDIGLWRNWLYSTRLHPDGARLENDIRDLMA